MATLKDVFAELNALKDAGIVREYAIGGATAVLFYAEPTRTYDLDVFVLLANAPAGARISLQPCYGWAAQKDFPTSAEHIIIHGVPVQFLPAHNALAEAAVATARTIAYEDVPVRVIGPEHLAALAFQAGGARRRERAWQLLDEPGVVDRDKFDALAEAHGIKIDSSHGSET